MSDPSFSLDSIFKLVEMVAVIAGGGAIVFKVGRMSQRFEEASTRVSERFEESIKSQGENIKALQTDVRELNKLMTSVSVQKERLDNQDSRLERTERLVDDLRRGEGRILPLTLGAKKPTP